jgi:RNA polymerase sigma-70 factor (ECF subfamily)
VTPRQRFDKPVSGLEDGSAGAGRPAQGNFPQRPGVPSCGTVVKSDEHLIDEALGGDTLAFGQLVRRYQGRLFNTLLHMVGVREDAEDAMQDAFVQAYVNLESFQGRSAFYTWLYRIAFNVLISRKRRKRREVSLDAARAATGEEPMDSGHGPGAQVLRREQVEQVHTALAELNDDHRAILVLREIEGCCYETIAEVLDLPVGTVRSRLHRARLQLRDQLREVVQENLAD